jgi:predicted hydrocarbon binding protein
MSQVEHAVLPVRFFRLFLDTMVAELGRDTLETVLEKADLPVELAAPKISPRSAPVDSAQSAIQAYARIQKAMRIYYGRGARGSLTRIGRLMWIRSLESATFSDKAQSQFVRSLPVGLRPKPALELLARMMREKSAGVTVHSQDTDLLLVDHSSAALGQGETNPICYVTLGLIQENLFWATAHEHDIEEVSCCAAVGHGCEFRIKLEGKM